MSGKHEVGHLLGTYSAGFCTLMSSATVDTAADMEVWHWWLQA